MNTSLWLLVFFLLLLLLFAAISIYRMYVFIKNLQNENTVLQSEILHLRRQYNLELQGLVNKIKEFKKE